MNPSVWGPQVWTLLVGLCSCTDQSPEVVRRFITAVAKLLPCKKCRDNFHDYLAETPFPGEVAVDSQGTILHSHDDMQLWLFNAKEAVNYKTKCKSITLAEFKDKCVLFPFMDPQLICRVSLILLLNNTHYGRDLSHFHPYMDSLVELTHKEAPLLSTDLNSTWTDNESLRTVLVGALQASQARTGREKQTAAEILRPLMKSVGNKL